MSQCFFDDTAWVEIQGKRALRLVRREDKCAEYEVIGYSGQVVLKDYRDLGLQAIDEVHRTQKIDEFPYRFNAPASVKIPNLDSAQLLIELHNTTEVDPTNRLWIAIGIAELPIYDYIHKRIVPFDDSFALVALYHRNINRQTLSSSFASAGV